MLLNRPFWSEIWVLPVTPLGALFCFDLSQKVARLINKDVDLVDLRNASTVFSFQILSTGKRVYCSFEKKCEAYESLIYSDYVRLNDERKHIIQDIIQTGKQK